MLDVYIDIHNVYMMCVPSYQNYCAFLYVGNKGQAVILDSCLLHQYIIQLTLNDLLYYFYCSISLLLITAP